MKIKSNTEQPLPVYSGKAKAHPRRSEFCHVYVWKTKADMHKQFPESAPTFDACFNGYTRISFDKDGEMKSPVFGALHFHRGSCASSGVIAHEACHAALEYFRHMGFSLDMKADENSTKVSQLEESFSWVLGYITQQVVDQTFKHRDYSK